MERPKQEAERSGKSMRFRVASAHSGRVLTEVFKDELGPAEPDGGRGPAEAQSAANSHLSGLVDESGGEPDQLLLYASAKRDPTFSSKRVDICSKNGTIRGVRNKVSAGQALFNNLANLYSGSVRHQKRRAWEEE